MTSWLLPNIVKDQATEPPAKRAKVGTLESEQTCYYSMYIRGGEITFVLEYCELDEIVVSPGPECDGGGSGGGSRNDDVSQWNWPRPRGGGGGSGNRPGSDNPEQCRPPYCGQPDPEEEQPGPEPCRGDPVPNPEIAPTPDQGIFGGRFGAPRSDETPHKGLDIKSPIGDPLYSIFDGQVYAAVNSEGDFGSYIIIESDYNSESIFVLYAHLSSIDLTSNTVNASGLIGENW